MALQRLGPYKGWASPRPGLWVVFGLRSRRMMRLLPGMKQTFRRYHFLHQMDTTPCPPRAFRAFCGSPPHSAHSVGAPRAFRAFCGSPPRSAHSAGAPPRKSLCAKITEKCHFFDLTHPSQMSLPAIFISYRIADTLTQAGRLNDTAACCTENYSCIFIFFL